MHMPRHLSVTFAAAVLLMPLHIHAQQAATISGRVVTDGGAPLAAATVFIESLGAGTTSGNDGRYAFTIPAARVQGQSVTITARLIGYKAATAQVTLTGGQITQNFTLTSNPLRLGEVVITGAGTATQTEKLGSVRNAVSAEQVMKSNESNIVQALAAKAPNVEVTQSSGEPGASSFIRMRGTRTILGDAQPLFVIDGVPIDNTSTSTSNFNPLDELGSGEISGTTQMNRAIDLNPADIESIEILKGPAAGAIYGARAAQGVVLITTKRGAAGQTRYTSRTNFSFDDVSRTYPLQRRFGQGLNGLAAGECNDINIASCLRSWGAELSAGTPTFDHANEAYDTGHLFEQSLSASGGNDRTTFFLSGSFVNNDGVFKGPNNTFQRATARLNATHRVSDRFELKGNVAFNDSRGDFVQRGNNVNGLQLGLLRTPPDFNNLPYIDPVTGLHRSYRLQNPSPGSASDSRGFDNPFFALYEPVATSTVGRVLGNIGGDYLATSWLKLAYSLGADYLADERLEGAPQASSDVSAGGRVTEGKIVSYLIDHNLTATANWRLSDNFAGTFTLGQNLNQRNNRQLSVVGRTLVAPTPFRLSNTVVRDQPIDNQTDIRQESYFGQGTVDLWDQLYLTFALRNDGSSTFSEENRRNWFPKGSVSWDISRYVGQNNRWLTFGKLRAAYGEAGVEPLPYLTSTTFNGSTILAGISQGTGLTPTQAGLGGLFTGIVKGAEDLKPERTKETELGFDLGLLRETADLSFTWYNGISDDVIFLKPLAPSSGFFTQAQNAAKFRNRGVEVSVNLRPLTRPNYAWDIGLQWARNRGEVLELRGADFVTLDPTSITPAAVAKKGEPIGAFYDYGWVRCGITPDETLDDLAASCQGKPRGALYLDANGFPVGDDTQRIIGDPNPDWTGSIRSGFRFGAFTVSGLVDIRRGGDVFNGTRGALRSYGTHKDTEVRANCVNGVCTGNERRFGSSDWYPGPVAGPGVDANGQGKAVPIGENWWRQHPASDNCVFAGYSEACMEDGGYVKLREITVGWTLANAFVRQSLGLSSVELRVAGRNLHTWTDYEGYDPETNLGGSIQKTRGMDYFNMPQSRSLVITVGLNR
jgi:TonB-linked SusC/RagA family outer membrane protein